MWLQTNKSRTKETNIDIEVKSRLNNGFTIFPSDYKLVLSISACNTRIWKVLHCLCGSISTARIVIARHAIAQHFFRIFNCLTQKMKLLKLAEPVIWAVSFFASKWTTARHVSAWHDTPLLDISQEHVWQ